MSLEVMEHRCSICGCIGPGMYMEGQESPYRPDTRFRVFICTGCQKEHGYNEKQEN